jgi:hypothetical protein
MISAIAAIEQSSSGQIGQPAACMIENNPILSASSGFLDARLWPFASREQGSIDSAGTETTVRFSQSTATVDNFVGNPPAPSAKPRKFKARDGLLKT